MKTITINKVPVEVAAPYEAGHKITEAEAKALNQVRAENIANNMRAKIKEMIETNGGDEAAVTKEAQAAVAAYDQTYEFTLASVGGGRRSLDPVEKEARSIANALLMDKLRENGVTKKAYIEANGEDAFKEKLAEVAEMEQVVAKAKENVAAREKMADISL